MKPKMMMKIIVDVGMTVLLLLLMTYELIGQEVHEWLGVGMFVLLLLHHVLNKAWEQNVLKGRYSAVRILQTGLVIGVLLAMMGSMISGVILSRYVFSALPIRGGRSFARSLHMVCAYGGFVLMSLHLGFHWMVMMGTINKYIKRQSVIHKWLWRIVAVIIAGYGIFAFVKRDIGSYMFLKNQFVFFDFEEPLILFLLDYVSIMGLFVFISHYSVAGLRQMQKKKVTGKI